MDNRYKYITGILGLLLIVFGVKLYTGESTPITQKSDHGLNQTIFESNNKKEVINTESNKDEEGSIDYDKNLNQTSDTTDDVLKDVSEESVKIQNIKNKLFTKEKALDIDSVSDLFQNPSKFVAFQDEITELYSYSEKALENKVKYEELLLMVKEQNNSEVNLNRIECGEDKCLASVRMNSMSKSVVEYVSNLRNSKSSPLNSLVVGQSDGELLMVFSTGQTDARISLSKRGSKQ